MTNNTALLVRRLVAKELGRIQTQIERGVDPDQLPHTLRRRDEAYRAAMEVGADTAFVVARSRKMNAVFPLIPAIA